MDDETAVRALLDRRAEANRNKDADAAVRPCAENAVNFDLAPALAQRGKEVKDPSGPREWFATRSTVCLKKDETEWEIVHEHTSFPMRMDGSEKAATTLKPDT